MNKISAVIVIYFPDIEQLNKLIKMLSTQVQNIIIVDNSDNKEHLSFDDSACDLDYIKLGENEGVAKAQNIGIAKAKVLNSTDVILFDQDSTPSISLIVDLLIAREKAENTGVQVAAIGPIHIDEDTLVPFSFVSTNDKKLTVFQPDFSSEYMICDYIIASGCMINITVLDAVGLMESGLFIDCVDIEWSYRAKALGLLSLCAPKAKMHHKIGGTPLSIFGRSVITHHPIRHYYFYRNFHLLLRRDYVPRAWKLHFFKNSLIQACIFCSCLSPRLGHFKAIIKGVFHGLKGNTGRYKE